MSHNRNHLTNMERLWTVFHVAAKATGATTRITDNGGREADLDRMSWRLRKGFPLVKQGVPREEWLDAYTRKMNGVPFSKWSDGDKDAVRRFIEACDAHGTNGW